MLDHNSLKNILLKNKWHCEYDVDAMCDEMFDDFSIVYQSALHDKKAEISTILAYMSGWIDDLEECKVSDIEDHIKTAKKMIEFYAKQNT